MNKKGSLELSVVAIVVIVIAFVVLGLGLSLTRTIFKGAESKLPEAFDLTKLEAEPTSENPITIAQTVEIDRNKAETMNIGFYNKHDGTAFSSVFWISGCLTKEGQAVINNLPTIASTSMDVGASDAKAYSIILNENGLTADTYICTMTVKCGAEPCSQWSMDGIYEQKQFFMKVIA